MTEQQPENQTETTVSEAAPAEKSRSRTRMLLVASILLLAAGGAFFASQSGLDRELVRQRVEAFALALKEQGAKDGREIILTYKDIVMDGGFSNRHAVIVAPQITISPSDPKLMLDKRNRLIITSDAAEVYAASMDLSLVDVRLPQPIYVSSADVPDKKLLTVTTNAPLVTTLGTLTKDGRPMMQLSQQFPSQINFTYLREQQAEGAEDATPTIIPVYETLQINVAEGASFAANMSQDGSGLGDFELAIKDVLLKPEKTPDAAIKIQEIKTQWSNIANDKNQHVVSASAHVGDITADPALLPYVPITLEFEASYEGSMPKNAGGVAAEQVEESALKLKQLLLKTKEASLSASADFVATSTDMLPVGMANVTLTNVPYVLKELRSQGVLHETNEMLVTALLEQLTGQKLAEITDAKIDINRIRGGAFAIGKSTFEELFATVLALGMKNALSNPPEPVKNDALEAPEKPESKQLEIEEGARG